MQKHYQKSFRYKITQVLQKSPQPLPYMKRYFLFVDIFPPVTSPSSVTTRNQVKVAGLFLTRVRELLKGVTWSNTNFGKITLAAMWKKRQREQGWRQRELLEPRGSRHGRLNGNGRGHRFSAQVSKQQKRFGRNSGWGRGRCG